MRVGVIFHYIKCSRSGRLHVIDNGNNEIRGNGVKRNVGKDENNKSSLPGVTCPLDEAPVVLHSLLELERHDIFNN